MYLHSHFTFSIEQFFLNFFELIQLAEAADHIWEQIKVWEQKNHPSTEASNGLVGSTPAVVQHFGISMPDAATIQVSHTFPLKNDASFRS